MDIELARTFLEIVKSGSFMVAATRLHITQTTVTARIHNLEGLLGCRLFVRNRSGARLTENGAHFVNHANQLVQVWEASRRDLPLPETSRNLVALGCETSLWDPLLVNWLSRLNKSEPTLAVRADVGECDKLQEKLQLGLIDAAVVHQPRYEPGVQIEHLIEEKLVLVAAASSAEPYVYVDWGEHFRQQHDAALPQFSRSAIAMNLGPLALKYLLANGGRGYFRTRVAQRHLDNGSLMRVAGAPEFSYPVYLMYKARANSQALNQALPGLRAALEDFDAW